MKKPCNLLSFLPLSHVTKKKKNTYAFGFAFIHFEMQTDWLLKVVFEPFVNSRKSILRDWSQVFWPCPSMPVF